MAKATRKSKSRLLAATKLSDYHIKRILRSYALGTSARDTSKLIAVSYVTIRQIYTMIRARMVALNVYPTLDSFYSMKREDAREAGTDFPPSFEDDLSRTLATLRGGARDPSGLHTSEMIFRWEEGARDAKPAVHYALILKLIQLSGPLNRPMTEEGRRRANSFLLYRQLNNLLVEERRMDAAFYRDGAALDDDDPDFD